jgi:hypothetical protein
MATALGTWEEAVAWLMVIWQGILRSQGSRVCPKGENRPQVTVLLVLWTFCFMGTGIARAEPSRT